ncbi:hypothetical protein ACJIZ3_004304 [Penstemon smallii]|uniref:BACK domain-containing protein n=1 Tax=Penstemon smallii TaxID=265156 RepID=A0ABD3S1P3_9LAMI
MDSASCPPGIGSTDYSLESGFAFNDADRILSRPGSDLDESLTDSARNPKRRRDDHLNNSAEEVAVLLDLFMNSNTPPRTTPSALLNVLMSADKCSSYCNQLLRNLPMTCELALLYLDLPSTITVQPLIDAAKLFLASHFKDVSKFKEEILKLPLAGIEAVLSSDDLQVDSEDAVYDLVLKWARTHYPELKERQRILSTSILGLIQSGIARTLTLVSHPRFLFVCMFMRLSYRPTTSIVVVGDHRLYKYHPVKVVNFEEPRKESIVYIQIKPANPFLANAGRVYLHEFQFGGQAFYLSCTLSNLGKKTYFGMSLGMRKKGGSEEQQYELTVEYKFGLWGSDHVPKFSTKTTFTGGKEYGCRNLFGVPWTGLIADDSPYLFNGTLDLRAELAIPIRV